MPPHHVQHADMGNSISILMILPELQIISELRYNQCFANSYWVFSPSNDESAHILKFNVIRTVKFETPCTSHSEMIPKCL